MDIINETPFRPGYLLGRVNFPGHSLTVVVKATFDLNPAGPVTVAEEQLDGDGDVPYEDAIGEWPALRYGMDFGHFKPRADLLLVGNCHPPVAVPECTATFAVGKKQKSLKVYGERSTFGGAKPFTKMPIRFELGAASKNNPVGTKGQPKIEPIESKHLPSFGPVPMMWPSRFARTGDYGGSYMKERWPWYPIDFDYAFYNLAPAEMQLDGYLKGDEPVFCEFLHPEHPRFHTRLPGIRVRYFVNVIDPPAVLPPALPPATPPPTTDTLREVTLNLDTLWVDMENGKLVLVWRGVMPVSNEDFPELSHMLVVAEKLDEAPKSLEYYTELLAARRKGPPEDEGFVEEPGPVEEPFDYDKWAAELDAHAEAELAKYGLKPPKGERAPMSEEDKADEQLAAESFGIKPKLTRDDVIAAVTQGKSLAGSGLKGLDLTGIDLSGVDFTGATLTECLLTRCRLAGTKLAGATLLRADLTEADLTGADLTEAVMGECKLGGARLAGATLVATALESTVMLNADLTKANLTGAIFEKADLRGATLSEAILDQANFTSARLGRANLSSATMNDTVFNLAELESAVLDNVKSSYVDFTGAKVRDVSAQHADLTYADFAGADLTGSNFRHSILNNASFERAQGPGVDFSNADMTKCRASGRANFVGANFNQINAPECIFETAILSRATFVSARLEKGLFAQANLDEATFLGAFMKSTVFTKASMRLAKVSFCDLFGASFEKVDLSHADMTGSNCYGAEFLEANLQHTKFGSTNLKMTKLAGRAWTLAE